MRAPPVVVLTSEPDVIPETAKLVVVALVPVAVRKVKFWRVVEPLRRRFESDVRPPVAVSVVPIARDPVKFAAEEIV